ncbi:radical SAM protein [Candidatus Fermentibacteria bacterium]|nr:radical SAM protein [Candidatus Fermentibacteria bacterium]
MTDFLVVSPPLCTPAEPSSGAFLLSGALKARGFTAPFLDLSPEFFSFCREAMEDDPRREAWRRAEARLRESKNGFDPVIHRTATGIIHSALAHSTALPAGWKATLMDLIPPFDIHSPLLVREMCEKGRDPFSGFWDAALDPVLKETRPETVLLSLSYLSQLAGAVSLAFRLERAGVRCIAGGSLPNSLALTGSGLGVLGRVLPGLRLGDGGDLAGLPPGRILEKVVFPDLAGGTGWMSPRMVVPFTLSTGCCWNRCLFCPDRDAPWSAAPAGALDMFLESVPVESRGSGRPVLHLLDSALPPGLLARALPSIRRSGLGFFGFARPTRELLSSCPPKDLADSGCLMLQLGVESGSPSILERFCKGFGPEEAEETLVALAGAGIRTYAYLLFGLPGEEDADRRDTAALVERAGDSIDFLNLSIFNLPRHCELSRRAGEFGIETRPAARNEEDRIALYHEFTWRGETPRAVSRRFIAGAAKTGTALYDAVKRTPRWLRASHMAMMRLPGRNPP